MRCSLPHCSRLLPRAASLSGSVSPWARACRMRWRLVPSRSLRTLDNLIPISSSKASSWLCSRTRSCVSWVFMRVRVRQARCSGSGTKLSINFWARCRLTRRSASLKSCLRPRGARLENACANCSFMCGSSSIHTGLQYCAVDSITASPAPCASSHRRNRCSSPAVLPKRRRAATCPACSACTSSTITISTFLCTSIPAIVVPILASWCGNGRTRGIGHYAPSRAAAASHRKRGATLIGSIRASQTKLRNGLNSPRAEPAFPVPHPTQPNRFSSSWVGATPIDTQNDTREGNQTWDHWNRPSCSRQVFLDPGVVGVDEFFGGAVEDDAPVIEDEESDSGVDAVFGAVLGDGLHAAVRIVPMGGHDERVLQPVGDDQGSRMGYVPLLHH